MDLFTYLLKKKGHNSSVNGDLFSYLLASRKRGTYQTYTGTQINVSNSVNSRMKNWILGGNSNQNGTPTPDAPIDIHNVVGENNVIENTGKNLYDTVASTVNLNGLTPVVNIDGSLSCSGTITQTWSNLTEMVDIFLPAGTYTFSLSKSYPFRCVLRAFKNKIQEGAETNYTNIEIASGNTSKTITLTENVYHLRFYITGVTANTEVDQNFKIQFEAGSTATEFEKYKGKNYKVSLTTNMTIPENEHIYITGAGLTYGIGVSDEGVAIPIKQNTSYKVSVDTTMPRYRVGTTTNYSSSGGNLNNGVVKDNTNEDIIIYNSNDNYLIINVNDLSKLVVTEFTIELCKIGDYQDRIYKSNDKWYLEKNIGKYTAIESTGMWYLSGVNNCFKTLLENTPINNVAPYNFENSLNIGAFNRLLKQALPNDLYLGNEENAFGISNTQSVGVYFRIDGISTREDFINWLNTNQPVIYYVYATPVITEITDDNLINQLEELAKARSFEEQTNISQLSEQLPFDLTVDIKTL